MLRLNSVFSVKGYRATVKQFCPDLLDDLLFPPLLWFSVCLYMCTNKFVIFHRKDLIALKKNFEIALKMGEAKGLGS